MLLSCKSSLFRTYLEHRYRVWNIFFHSISFLQHFGHLMRRADSLQKTLMLGKIEGKGKRGWQRMRWLDGITNSVAWVWASSGDGVGQGSLACYSPWGRKESDMTERLNNSNNQLPPHFVDYFTAKIFSLVFSHF